MNASNNGNISLLLQKLASEHAGRPAIVDAVGSEIRVASFGELEMEVSGNAEVLKEAGVRPLDVVLIYVPVRRELISLLLAVFRLGAQALFIDPTYGPDKIWHCLRLARPKFLVLDNRLKFLTAASPLLKLLGVKGLLIFNDQIEPGSKSSLEIFKSALVCKNQMEEFVREQEEQPALITFTSGSTGRPKGIVRSHKFLANQAVLLDKTLPTGWPASESGDHFNVLTTLPMFVLAALAVGHTAIIPAAREDILLRQLRFIAIDRILCAPASLEKICRLLLDASMRLDHLKQVVVGGGPVFPSLVARVKSVMPEAEITTVYGSTEAEPICHRTLDNQAGKDTGPVGLVPRGLPLGKPIPEITLAIIQKLKPGKSRILTADQFEALRLPAYKEGEIIVSGDHVIKNYIGGIGERETKLEIDGRVFHRTGDAGYINKHGEVFLTGRVSCGVETGGETVYPLSAELIAMEVEGVERCAFAAIGDKSVLAVVLKSGNNHKQVLDNLELAFRKSKIPIDRIVAVNSLPLDERHGSKIVYSKLQKQLRSVS